jgi:DNA polymerase epsilon subunit 2
MYRERVQLVQQRLLRSGEFVMRGMGPSAASKAAAAGVAGGGAHELSTIESLLGSSGVRVLLGILTQPAEGAWHLEDLGSTIRLDLRQAQASKALFTEGAVVVLQGELSPTDSTLFVVYVIGMPPAELRDATVEAMGVQDPFGNNTRRSQWVQMKELEQEAAEAMIVVLSDVTISKPGVCDQLRAVFEGFERTDASPLFVLMGPFLARDFLSPGGRAAAVAAFAALADTLASCPRLCDAAKFLLVPGPRDPGAAAAYPRRPLPSFLTDPLAKRVKHLSSASNPCRVRFYTQELVFFRENLLKRMQRNAVIPPQLSPEDPDVTEQLVETIMEQAHLFPLPSHVAPVYWELDHSMRLTPLPHLLVLGDRGDQYSWTHKDCNAVNPGSFQTDGSFVVYRPSSREVEFSRVG